MNTRRWLVNGLLCMDWQPSGHNQESEIRVGSLMLKKNKNTIHPLCARCIKTCKETVSVVLLSCDRFEPQMSDDEFDQLLNDMDEITRQADALHTRVNRLLDEMQDDVVVTENDESKAKGDKQ